MTFANHICVPSFVLIQWLVIATRVDAQKQQQDDDETTRAIVFSEGAYGTTCTVTFIALSWVVFN